MIAVLSIALLATVAVASAFALADAAIRGRNAFRLFRGDMVRLASDRRITVTFADVAGHAAMPVLRPVSANRASQRRTVRAQVSRPLRAAA